MDHGEKIKELEEKERALMVQSVEGAKTGEVSPALHYVNQNGAMEGKLRDREFIIVRHLLKQQHHSCGHTGCVG